MYSIRYNIINNYIIGKKSVYKRLGRGNSSGLGNTCCRGQKGQKSRSGYSNKLYFTGGQTPLNIQYSKVGFKSKIIKLKYINYNNLLTNLYYYKLIYSNYKLLYNNLYKPINKTYLSLLTTKPFYLQNIYIGSYNDKIMY